MKIQTVYQKLKVWKWFKNRNKTFSKGVHWYLKTIIIICTISTYWSTQIKVKNQSIFNRKVNQKDPTTTNTMVDILIITNMDCQVSVQLQWLSGILMIMNIINLTQVHYMKKILLGLLIVMYSEHEDEQPHEHSSEDS